MPTTAERRALWFLAAALTLGAAVRAAQARQVEHLPAATSDGALDRQLAAVDSARLRQGHRNRGRDSRGPAGGSAAQPAIAGVLPRGTASSAPGARAGAGAVAALPPAERPLAPPPPATASVDVDVASSGELDALPGLGPTLASRIVAERSRNGPFGSLAGLARVKGIGPALLARLAPHIRFSGVAAGNAPVTGAPREGRRRSKRVSGHALGEQAALDRPLSRREF